MRISTRDSLKKHLALALLFLLLPALASCSPESESDVPEETTQEETAPEAHTPEQIGFTLYERNTQSDVYLNGEAVGDMKESEIHSKITSMAAAIDVEAVDAAMDPDTWQVKKGKVGKKVNIEKTMDLLLNAGSGQKVDLVVEEIMPPVTSQKLLGNIVVIGDYTTKLLNRSKNRVNNIDIAAEKIDCHKLSPGEEFSFNKVVGRRTEAKGYEEAPIIIKTKNGPKEKIAVGGGICQLSTTLYNALEECKNIEIVERHLHSKNVKYVPKGEDATVSYGSADFRFRNSRGHPIMIRTSLSKKYLNVRIIENRNL